ncbi:MAG: hypothetical protein AB7F86_13460 [Bdellovibrionales bacterium]
MRILRGKSNLEVSANGFALFVVGLILATFIGGAARTLLNSSRAHQKVLMTLRAGFPGLEIDVASTEVLLSRGLWPAIGLKLTGLHLKQNTCNRLSFDLLVPSAVLPVRLSSLLKARPRLGIVDISGGSIRLHYQPCHNVIGSADKKGVELETPVTGKAEGGIKLTAPKWRDWAKNFDGVELNSLHVTYSADATWKAIVNSANLYVGSEIVAHANLDLQKSLPFGVLSHLVEIDAHGEGEVLNATLTSEYKEGRVLAKASWDADRNLAVARLEFNQLPLKELLSELHTVGLTPNEIQLRSTWLSCAMDWEGHPKAELPDQVVKLESCKLEGAYGGIVVEPAKLRPWSDPMSEAPVLVRVEKLQLQPLVEALNREVLPKVIPKLGDWTGVLNFRGPSSWNMEGRLENLEVTFSNESVRGKQIVRKMRTIASRNGDKVEAEVGEIILSDGDLQGRAKFTLKDDWRSGAFDVNISALKLAPAVQNLLVGGQWTDLKLVGSGQLDEGDLSEWQGVLEMGSISGPGWKGDRLVLQSQYAPQTFKISAQIAQVDIDPNWSYLAQARGLRPSLPETVELKDVRAKINVRKTGGEIGSLIGFDRTSGKSWRLKGNWLRDGDFIATLTLPDTRNLPLRASKGVLSLD